MYALEATTTRDVDSVLDVISGSISADDLIEELRKPLEETIDMWTAKVGNTDIGKYGGIGLTIEKDPDGIWRTKCIVDAEVFAILDPSGATGENSRHPFIVKDGVVYMNKLLLDDAEIGSVIAKYINVQNLVAVNITASTIKSSDNGASFSLLPDGTMSCTKATIKGAVTATSGSFTGTVNANAGTFNNITIAENCNVLGTIYADRIVGDVCKTVTTSSINTEVRIEAFNRDRKLVILSPTQFKVIPNSSGTSQSRNVRIRIFVNDVLVVSNEERYAIPVNPDSVSISGHNHERLLPAGQDARVKFVVDVQGVGNYYDWRFTISQATPLVVMAFIQ